MNEHKLPFLIFGTVISWALTVFSWVATNFGLIVGCFAILASILTAMAANETRKLRKAQRRKLELEGKEPETSI